MSSNRRLALLLAAMVLVPIAALAWVGTRLVGDQAALARHEVDRVFLDRLESLDRAIVGILNGLERELARYEDALPDAAPFEVHQIRDVVRKFPRDIDLLVLDADGRRVFPPTTETLSRREQRFLERTRAFWEGGLLLSVARPPGDGAGAPKVARERGWLAFFADGVQQFMWWHSDGRKIAALEVPNVLVLSELVMQLPDTPVESEADVVTGGDAQDEGRTVLSDAMGAQVYQWGAYTPRAGETPKATLALSEPLGAWSLRHYAPESALPGRIASTLRLSLYGGLGGLALALGAGAWLVWRARTREMKLARDRVSFVNQVSHELKTPLTNLRMYTELLKDRLDAEDLLVPGDPLARHVDVLERETERLARMIKNVLSFARGQEDRLTVSPRPTVPDEVVQATLATFMPNLEQARLVVSTDLAAGARVSLDPDVLEQVLANLVSNVEKYGRAGGVLRVATRVQGDTLHLIVGDDGPGIRPEHRDKVFEPFWRASSNATQATGTGIGLDIARRLARLHGGDLRLLPSDRGATFEATFRCPAAP
ncbi:MAG: HAMP domain-containing histidine kinase [Deltaproteobacteria bacterium]|nr:HAMP domain-containing histidine kinase [Deltaproteobacteria bacterium]